MDYLIILVTSFLKFGFGIGERNLFTTISQFYWWSHYNIVIGLILFKHIIMALSAPFMSPVSEKIEAHLTGKPHSHRREIQLLCNNYGEVFELMAET